MQDQARSMRGLDVAAPGASAEPAARAAWLAAVDDALHGKSPDSLIRSEIAGVPRAALYDAPVAAALTEPVRLRLAARGPWRVAAVLPALGDRAGDMMTPATLAVWLAEARAAEADVVVVPADDGIASAEIPAWIDALAAGGVAIVIDASDDRPWRAGAAGREGIAVRALRAAEAGAAWRPTAAAASRWLADGLAAHDAGADAPTALAWALWQLWLGVHELRAAGAELADAWAGATVRLGLDGDAMVGVANVRAAHAAIARMGSVWGLAAGTAAPCLEIHTTRRSRPGEDPWLPLVRSSVEAAAAALGGADVIALPATIRGGTCDPAGLRLGVTTQAVLQRECGLADVADACAGAPAIEAWTHAIAHAAWRQVQAWTRDPASAAATPAVASARGALGPAGVQP